MDVMLLCVASCVRVQLHSERDRFGQRLSVCEKVNIYQQNRLFFCLRAPQVGDLAYSHSFAVNVVSKKVTHALLLVVPRGVS